MHSTTYKFLALVAALLLVVSTTAEAWVIPKFLSSLTGAGASSEPASTAVEDVNSGLETTHEVELSKRAYNNSNVPWLYGNINLAAGNFIAAPYIKSVAFVSGTLGVCEYGGISFKPKIKVTICNTQSLNPGTLTGFILIRKNGPSSKPVIQTNQLNTILAAAAPAGTCFWGKGVVITGDASMWFNQIPTAAPMQFVAGVKWNNMAPGLGAAPAVLPAGKCGLSTGNL